MAQAEGAGLFVVFFLSLYTIVLVPYTIYKLCNLSEDKQVVKPWAKVRTASAHAEMTGISSSGAQSRPSCCQSTPSLRRAAVACSAGRQEAALAQRRLQAAEAARQSGARRPVAILRIPGVLRPGVAAASSS